MEFWNSRSIGMSKLPTEGENHRLIKGLQSNDSNEFNEAFANFQKRFKKPGQKILRDLYDLPDSVTEELYQDALNVVIVQAKIATLKDPASLDVWFFQVLKREALQWLRKNKAALSKEEFMSEDEWATVAERELIDPFQEKPDSLELQAYQEALLELTPEEQDYVRTEVLPELKIKDIAQQREISATAARKRKQRTMVKLKKLCLEKLDQKRALAQNRARNPKIRN